MLYPSRHTHIAACVFYAPPMRRRRYVTMLDPLQERYGDVMTGLLFIGATFADLLWAASILAALGRLTSYYLCVSIAPIVLYTLLAKREI